ncbi:MAG: tetratricopeptide repeat protein [bacterium]
MILRCENCQTMYMFTESQLKSQNYKFTCKKCGHENTVALPSDTDVIEQNKQQPPDSSQSIKIEEHVPEEIKDIVETPVAKPPEQTKEETSDKEFNIDDIFDSLDVQKEGSGEKAPVTAEPEKAKIDLTDIDKTEEGLKGQEEHISAEEQKGVTREEDVIEGFEEFTLEDTGAQKDEVRETQTTPQTSEDWLESTMHEQTPEKQGEEKPQSDLSFSDASQFGDETIPEILSEGPAEQQKVEEPHKEEASLLTENDVAIPDAATILKEVATKQKPVTPITEERHVSRLLIGAIAGSILILLILSGVYYYLVEYTPSHPDLKKLAYMSYSIMPVSAKDKSQALQLLKQADIEYLRDTINGYEKSLSLYEKAVSIDHKLPEAYLGIAKDYAVLKDRNNLTSQLNNSSYFLSRLRTMLKDNAQYNIVKALFALANNNYREASDDINTALRKSPNLPEALYYRGYIDYKMGQPLSAVTQNLEKALSLEPGLTKARLLMARVYQQQGDFSRANEQLDSIIASNPDNVQALILKADIESTTTTGTTHAISMLNDTLKQIGNKIDKYDRANLYYALGNLYKNINDYSSAIKAFNTSLQDNRSANTYIALGDVYLKTGNIEEAEKHYKIALSIDSSSYEGNLKLAQAYYTDHKYVLAISYFTEALKLKKDDPDALYGLALARDKNGELDAALNTIQTAVKLSPDNPEIITLNARLLRKKNDYANAIALLSKAIDKFQNYAPLHTEYAVVLGKEGKYNDAIQQLNIAMSISPVSADNYAYMAYMLNKLGRYNDATNYVQKALSIDNRFPYAYEVMGDIYFKENRLNDAIKAYNTVINLQPYNDNVLYKLANVYTAGNMFTNAVSSLENAIKINPTNAIYHYQLGNVYRDMNNIQSAINEYSKAIDLDSTLADAYYQRGLMNIKGKNDLAAINDLKNAMKYAPDNPDYILALANYYYDNKETFSAIDYLNMALKIAPQNPELHYRLGIAYNYIGRIDDAKREFQTALKLSPNYSNAMVGLGNIYYQNGDTQKAQQYYETAIRLSPDNGDAYYALGTVYEYNGMYERALSAYKNAAKFSKNPATAYFKEGMMFANLNENKQAKEALLKAINLGLPADMDSMAKSKLRNLM